MKKYLLAVSLLGIALFLFLLGLKQYNVEEYFDGGKSKSGIFELVKEDPIRNGVRYQLRLKDDGTDYIIPGIISAAFDIELFQNTVKPGDSIVLQIKEGAELNRQEIISISRAGQRFLNTPERNSLRRRNGSAAILASLVFFGSGLWEFRKRTRSIRKDLI